MVPAAETAAMLAGSAMVAMAAALKPPELPVAMAGTAAFWSATEAPEARAEMELPALQGPMASEPAHRAELAPLAEPVVMAAWRERAASYTAAEASV